VISCKQIKWFILGIICFSQEIILADPPIIPITENPDVTKQVKGDYGTMQRKESLPLGAIQHGWDGDTDADHSGIYTIYYHPEEIIKLRIREHMATTIVFPKWEKIEKIVVGDPTALKTILAKPNIVLIESLEYIGIDTTITMIGIGGTYLFYVRNEGYNSTSLPDVGVYIKAREPVHLAQELGKGTELSDDYLEKVTFDVNRINFNFTMSGDPSIAPKRIYSDGYRTWFDYGEDIKLKKLPVIFAVVDGIDTPINAQRIRNKLVVQGDGKFTLKNGNKYVCVYPSPPK
jgi:type IV secretory pathway VirB9-like protein